GCVVACQEGSCHGYRWPPPVSCRPDVNLQRFKSNGASVSLPKHSYWFDFWLFVLFDIVFFLFMYFIVP
uniref:Uncharacterized protein n=1 Tax=Salarias fasciatus TaxID=181472 RepID=A0A672G6J8_SALFA